MASAAEHVDGGDDRREQAQQLMLSYKDNFPGIEYIGGAEVQRRRAAGERVVLVDVRTEEEQRVSMLPGAVTQEAFERELERDPAGFGGAMLVPYCTISFRSGIYAEKLQARVQELFPAPGAAPAVRNGEGVVMWSHDVGEFVAAEASGGSGGGDGAAVSVKRLHVYGSAWDVAADGFETRTFGTWRYITAGVGVFWDKYMRGIP